jgi:hypothetical protein
LKWAPLHAAVSLPAGSAVHFLVRGFDGLTVNHLGLVQFLERHAAVIFYFTFIQRRMTLSQRIRQELGRGPWLLNNNPVVERAMRALVYPRITRQDYLAALPFAPGLAHQLGVNHTLDIMSLWHHFSQGKAGNDGQWFNQNRNSFV